MKTYKTWEVIKMLESNRNLKFKSGHVQLEWVPTDFSQVIGWSDSKEPLRLSIEHLSYEWTLVQQPVSFIEAVKAYSEGKTIRCECSALTKNTIYRFCGVSNSPLKDQNESAVSVSEILEGKWYIED